MPSLKCDVCGQPALGVCSSSFGPVTFAYCYECINKPAEPRSTFEYLFEETGGEGLVHNVNEFFTFIDGRYVSWSDFLKMRRNESGIG